MILILGIVAMVIFCIAVERAHELDNDDNDKPWLR